MLRWFQLILLLIQAGVLVSCGGKGPSDLLSKDHSDIEISDFDGSWDGRLNCRWVGGYEPYALVIIRNGGGKLFHVGNYGEAAFSELDPQSGEIEWRGNFTNYEGKTGTPYVAFGEWRNDKFRISANRGNSLCEGLLTRKRKLARRLKRDDVMNLIVGKTEIWPRGAVYYEPEGELAELREGARLQGRWEVTRSGRVCRSIAGRDKLCHHYVFAEDGIDTVVNAKNVGSRKLVQGDILSDL